MKVFLASVIVAVCVIGSIVVGYALSLRALHTSQHQLCGVFQLLTSHPVPKPADPKANPSREQSYIFYIELKTLETQYSCKV